MIEEQPKTKILPQPLTAHFDEFQILPAIAEINESKTTIFGITDAEGQMYVAVTREGSDEIILHETDSPGLGNKLVEVATEEMERRLNKSDAS